MTQPESRLSRRIQQALRLEGWFCYKNHGNEFTLAGLPDITVCAEGYFIALETKMPEKRTNTSVRQDFVMGQIIEAGGYAQVVCSPEEAVEVVHNVLRARRRASSGAARKKS